MGVALAGVAQLIERVFVGVDLRHRHGNALRVVVRRLGPVGRDRLFGNGETARLALAPSPLATGVGGAYTAVATGSLLPWKHSGSPYLSGVAEGEIFPTEVIDDSCRQGVAQHVDHGPEPVAMVTEQEVSEETQPNVSKAEVRGTHRIQSMATISVMSSGGRPTDVRTITMVTRPAWGIPAAPMLAAVAVMLLGD